MSDPLLMAILRARTAPALANSPVGGLAALLVGQSATPTPAPAASRKPQWIAVTERFRRFHSNLLLTPLQREDAQTKVMGIVHCLNAHYYDLASHTANAGLIGSWAKETQTRPPRDVDLYFYLPAEVHARFQSYRGNRQSALLQEVKGVLARTYPSTDMRGDGQVVMVRFESYSVELVPAFELKSGKFWICDTNNGGQYKETTPGAELRHIEAIDAACSRNLRPLIRMLKAWQANCDVPIKSFHLELVAAQFLLQWRWRLEGWFYFDWMIRDFFAYLQHQHVLTAPGSSELIFLGDAWRSRADTAKDRAMRACDNERDNYVYLAGEEWQKIFGIAVPLEVS